MARESRRARFDKRFGKPERVADVLADIPINQWVIPKFLHPAIKAGRLDPWKTFDRVQGLLSSAMKIDATNVADYVYQNFKTEVCAANIPVSRPPSDVCFVEFQNTSHSCEKTRQMPSGLMCESISLDQLGIPWPNAEEGSFAVAMHPFTVMNGVPFFMGGEMIRVLDRSGMPAPASLFVTDGTPPNESGYVWLKRSSSIALFAFTFMNCKNVTTASIEPDRHLNRTRERHGLKPFLSYHTINIEPMKSVLKSEGGIESNGLKKALHVCRGHFATYSEERPLFGHFSGTVWVPAHTRGSFKNGVVKSDYKVNAPKEPSPC